MCRRMQIKWLTAISQICGNEAAKNQIHNHDHHHHHKSLLLLKSPSWSEMGQVKGGRFTTPGKQWKSQPFPPMFHRKIYEKSWEICNIKWVLTFRFRSIMIHSIGVEQLNMHSFLFPWCKASRLRADGGVCGFQDHWTILRRAKLRQMATGSMGVPILVLQPSISGDFEPFPRFVHEGRCQKGRNSQKFSRPTLPSADHWEGVRAICWSRQSSGHAHAASLQRKHPPPPEPGWAPKMLLSMG